jgi:hypothetical protein
MPLAICAAASIKVSVSTLRLPSQRERTLLRAVEVADDVDFADSLQLLG